MSVPDLKPHELMQKAADFFERQQVPYRVVGSMASMAYSEPRFTNDIDILVEMREQHVEALAQEFTPPDYYVSIPAVREAIRQRRQFNIIHLASGLKIDVIQRKDTAFSLADITHGQRLTNEGLYDAWFASAENVILMKLCYFKEGGSDKHVRDVASILLVQGATIDREYIAEWAETLGVSSEWQLVCDRVPKSQP